MKYKFDEPLRTKSGKSVVELWNELKEQKRLYNKWTYLEKNNELRLLTAIKIRHLQDDLGIKQSEYPDLEL